MVGVGGDLYMVTEEGEGELRRGKAALMIALVNGHVDLVETLLEREADLSHVNEVLIFILL